MSSKRKPISCTCERCFYEPTRDDVIAATEPRPEEVALASSSRVEIEVDLEPHPMRPLAKRRPPSWR